MTARKPKLHIVRGGKAHGGGGGDRGGPPPTKKAKKKRPNPLNSLLWYATSRAYFPNRATGVKEIAERMTKLSKRVKGYQIDVAESTAAAVIDDGRRRRHFYGWMLLHVEKGSVGFNRGYVPVLIDVDGQDVELYLLDDEDLEYAVSGLKSSVRTIESMVINDAEGLTFLIGCLEELGNRAAADSLREFAAECRAFARRAAEVRRSAENL